MKRFVSPLSVVCLLIGIYSCSNTENKKGSSTAPAAPTPGEAADVSASSHVLEDEPTEYDTTVTLGSNSYRLHVAYTSMNDNAVHQRVWFPTPKGDTPGVYSASNRQIMITAYQNDRQVFAKRIVKEDLYAAANSSIRSGSSPDLSTAILGEPELEDIRDNQFLFGASVGETDSDNGDWVEFTLSPQGILRVVRRESLLDE